MSRAFLTAALAAVSLGSLAAPAAAHGWRDCGPPFRRPPFLVRRPVFVRCAPVFRPRPVVVVYEEGPFFERRCEDRCQVERRRVDWECRPRSRWHEDACEEREIRRRVAREVPPPVVEEERVEVTPPPAPPPPAPTIKVAPTPKMKVAPSRTRIRKPAR